jgi:Carboxypeptidase regulatory-like domain
VIRKIAYSAAVVVFSCATAYAQSTLGTILGTVSDASGGVIAGATVKITDTDEGTSRTFQTDSKGNYAAVDSKPDHYSVEMNKTGFRTEVVPGLLLTAR